MSVDLFYLQKFTMDKKLSLQGCIDNVAKFHDAFGIENEDTPVGIVDDATYMLRYKLMREE